MSTTPRHQAQQAWQQALGQLRYTLNRADFEAWVRDARPLHYDGQVLTVGVANAYARDWLAERLRTPLENQLRGILNAPVQVVFVVATPQASPTPDPVPSHKGPSGTTVPQAPTRPLAPATSPGPTNAPSAEAVNLQEISLRLRDAFQQPHRVVFLPAYFLRWLPYLGTRAGWLYVALRQVYFLSSQHPYGPGHPIHPGQAVEATRQTLARWSHLTKRTINNILNQGLLTPLVHVERDRHRDAHRQAPNRYIFTADMPLTPTDRAAVLAFLYAHDLVGDPIGALSAALQQPHRALLAADPLLPPPAPEKRPAPSLRSEVATVLQPLNLPRNTLAKALGMAELLETALIEGEGKLFIPWYFIEQHLPRLGHTVAWLYLVARHHAEQEGRPAANGFRHLEVNGRRIAGWLGLKKVRYGRELVPVASADDNPPDTESPAAAFLRRPPGRGNTFLLAVQSLLPLTPQHERAYQIGLHLLAECVQRQNPAPLQEIQTRLREEGLEAAAYYLRHIVGGNNVGEEAEEVVWQEAAAALSRLAGQLPKISPGIAKTAAEQGQKFPPEPPNFSSETDESFPRQRPKMPTVQAKKFPHVNLKTQDNLSLQQKNPPRAGTSSSSSSQVGGKDPHTWQWEDLWPHLPIAPALKKQLLRKEAWLGMAWLLYVTAYYRRFDNPLGFALHKIQQGENPGGTFEHLARQPKERLIAHVQRHLRYGGETVVVLEPLWTVLQRAPREAMLQLAHWLGIGDFA